MGIYEELVARGLIAQVTNEDEIREATEPECAGKQKDSGTPQQEDARRAEKGKV